MSKNKKILKGYMCGYGPLELQLGATDVTIYPTIKSLKKNSPCWKACGILEISMKPKFVKKGKSK